MCPGLFMLQSLYAPPCRGKNRKIWCCMTEKPRKLFGDFWSCSILQDEKNEIRCCEFWNFCREKKQNFGMFLLFFNVPNPFCRSHQWAYTLTITLFQISNYYFKKWSRGQVQLKKHKTLKVFTLQNKIFDFYPADWNLTKHHEKSTEFLFLSCKMEVVFPNRVGHIKNGAYKDWGIRTCNMCLYVVSYEQHLCGF